MSGWEGFNKYVGIQGILALGLGTGFIVAPFLEVTLPQGYNELLSLVVGFYFAKNGVGIVGAIRRNGA